MSWSFFFNYLEWNIQIVNIYEEYNKYIKKLNEWIPPNLSLEKCFNYFTKKFHMEEIINNIRYPKPKLLKNVNMDDIEFLKEQAQIITKGLFEIEIKFSEVNYEYSISLFPKITCKISQSLSIQVENQTECFPIKNNISIGPKSLSPKFSQTFFDFFKLDLSSAICNIKIKLDKFIKNGTISIGFGYRKIQISISISRKPDLIKFAGTILYTIYFDSSLLSPVPVFNYDRNLVPYINPKGNLHHFPPPNPEPQFGLPDIGKWFNDNKEAIGNFAFSCFTVIAMGILIYSGIGAIGAGLGVAGGGAAGGAAGGIAGGTGISTTIASIFSRLLA